MNLTRPLALGCVLLMCFLPAGGLPGPASAQTRPEGEMRWAEPALMLINPYPWSAPLEEVRLKKR